MHLTFRNHFAIANLQEKHSGAEGLSTFEEIIMSG